MTALPRRLMASACALALMATQALAFETRARAAFVLDQTTGTVLMAKRADEALPPASMSKLMTLYIAFEAIREGRLRLNEELRVSQHAMDYGGSTLFLRAGERVKVEDLLRGIIVLSGNDACAVIAEALSPDGSERGFARLMTQRAQQLGMTSSQFANSNGWPAAGHEMSMRDLALLATRLIEDYPEYYPMFSQSEFLFDEKESQNRFNRNPLLGLGIGADGLKTGHTQEAGYGLVGSAKQGERRVIFAITGLDSAKARAEESEAIVNWSFRQFAEKTVIKKDTEVAQAEVWMGAKDSVTLVPGADVSMLVPTRGASKLGAEVVYTGPVEAPIAAGQQLGELILTPDGLPEKRIPLLAREDVAAGGFVDRVMTASKVLIDRMQDTNE
ncbi:MAG: D-alanyl-D-alanine carboxypeptidase [Pelagimonas sp.]|jgi:D-alanyl-D-alanine carboxypeptidase (penicillin-binding protein 5/6)|nr:D-alanyl-D-alanine carboxypeptidase [Pelagimonas sp.]